jgi:hypothetical protein
MAIKKSYLTTNGIIVDEAYYKVHNLIPWDTENSENTYQANIWVWANEYQRNKNPDNPLTSIIFYTFEVDTSAFDAKISDEENRIKQAYNKLKNLTDSFKNDGTDV